MVRRGAGEMENTMHGPDLYVCAFDMSRLDEFTIVLRAASIFDLHVEKLFSQAILNLDYISPGIIAFQAPSGLQLKQDPVLTLSAKITT